MLEVAQFPLVGAKPVGRGLIAAVVGSMLLHALLAVGLWRASPPEAIPTKAQARPESMHLVSVNLHPQRAIEALPRSPLSQARAISAPAERLDRADGSQASHALAPAAPPLESSEPSAADTWAAYWPTDQVDPPASPVEGWQLDLRSVPADLALHLEVRIWVSADGVVQGWEPIGPTAEDALALAVLQPLQDTLLRPALRDGIPVPSVRTLEISIAPQ